MDLNQVKPGMPSETPDNKNRKAVAMSNLFIIG